MIAKTLPSSRRDFSLCFFLVTLLSTVAFSAQAQQPPEQPQSTTPNAVSLTLKRAIELALQNTTDIQVAKLQASLANRSAMITKAPFLPNLYAHSAPPYPSRLPQ